MEFGVNIRGDEIEINLEQKKCTYNSWMSTKKGSISERRKQDHMTENHDELWSENEDDDNENKSGVLDTMLTPPDFLEDEER